MISLCIGFIAPHLKELRLVRRSNEVSASLIAAFWSITHFANLTAFGFLFFGITWSFALIRRRGAEAARATIPRFWAHILRNLDDSLRRVLVFG